MGARLERTRTLFWRVEVPELIFEMNDFVSFVDKDPEDEDDVAQRSLVMTRDLWEEFDSPEYLEVTIRPLELAGLDPD